MAASDRLPTACQVDSEWVRIGGEDWQPTLMRRADFDERFADIADAPDFLAALFAHPLAQTPGWQAAIAWIRDHS